LCKIIAMPCTVRSACESCSVSETAFYGWVRRGEEKGERLYAQFVQRLMRAKGQGKTKILRSIWDSDDVRVKLEALARIYPAEFGRVDVRPLPQPEPQEKINVAFILPDLKGKSLAEVAAFPVMTEEGAKARFESHGHDEPEPSEPDMNGEFDTPLS